MSTPRRSVVIVPGGVVSRTRRRDDSLLIYVARFISSSLAGNWTETLAASPTVTLNYVVTPAA